MESLSSARDYSDHKILKKVDPRKQYFRVSFAQLSVQIRIKIRL